MKLKNMLNEDRLNLKKIDNQINEVNMFNKIKNFNYLEDLMYPNIRHGVKIPSHMPIPSCTFTLKNTFKIQTNGTGQMGIKYNPFCLIDESIKGYNFKNPHVQGRYVYAFEPFSSLWLTRNTTSDGNDLTSEWGPYGIGQVIPEGIYSKYRLVSASIQVRYIGPLEEAEGYFFGAVVPSVDYSFGSRYYGMDRPDQPYIPNPNQSYPMLSLGGRFLVDGGEGIKHEPTYREGTCLTGLSMIYYPLDNSYLEYVNVIDRNSLQPTNKRYGSYANPYVEVKKDSYRGGFYWYIFSRDLPLNKWCILCDIVSNFECLPKAEFMNYAPVSIYP